MFRRVLTVSLLLAAACAHTPELAAPEADARSEDARLLASMREEARELVARQTELAWRRWAFGEAVDLAASYTGHERLFTLEAIGRAARVAAEARGDAKLALETFHLYLVGERIAASIAHLGEDGRTEVRAERSARIDAGVREAGFASRLALAAALRRADLASLRRLAEDTLARTDELYLPALAAMAQRSGLDPAAMRREDLQRLFTGTGVDASFPALGALDAARKTFAGLGVDPGAQAGLRIDQEPRPHKDPRAVALPVRVPGDVRVSIKPQGGLEDYRAALHEIAHALQFLHVRVAHWELGVLGASAATEAYALLFEALTETPAWLGAMSRLGDAARDAWVRDAAVKSLYLVRRAAAKVIFEIDWRGGRLADPAARWRELMTRAGGVAQDGGGFMEEQDDFLESADELRARLLAAQLQGALQARFGETWWTREPAGELLRSLWAEGNKLSADDVAKRLGAPGVDVQALLERVGASF